MNRTKMERIRLGLMLVAVVLFLGLAIARLVQFQIVDAAEYSAIVEKQSTGRIPIPAERGMIYDRYGRVVSKNVTRQALYAHPSSKAEATAIAAYLDKVFTLRKGEAVKKYKIEANRFRWIERQLDDRLAARIEKEAPPGLYLRTEMTRQYPFGLVGRQVLGYTNIDNVGLSGFELAYDSLLSGTDWIRGYQSRRTAQHLSDPRAGIAETRSGAVGGADHRLGSAGDCRAGARSRG